MRPAQADEGNRGAEEGESIESHRSEIGLGFTLALAPEGIGTWIGGVDSWYRPYEYAAFGLEAQVFVVDNGADAHYCEACLEGGTIVTAFAEGRLEASDFFAGFARVGLGPAFVRINHFDLYERDEKKILPALHVAVGPQLTVWHVFIRPRLTGTAMPGDAFLAYGLELGAVF